MGTIIKHTRSYFPLFRPVKRFNRKIIYHFDHADLKYEIGGKNQLDIKILAGIDNNILPSKYKDQRYIGWNYNLVTNQYTFYICMYHHSLITDYNTDGFYAKELIKVLSVGISGITLIFNNKSATIWIERDLNQKLIVGGYYPVIKQGYKKLIYPTFAGKHKADKNYKFKFTMQYK